MNEVLGGELRPLDGPGDINGQEATPEIGTTPTRDNDVTIQSRAVLEQAARDLLPPSEYVRCLDRLLAANKKLGALLAALRAVAANAAWHVENERISERRLRRCCCGAPWPCAMALEAAQAQRSIAMVESWPDDRP